MARERRLLHSPALVGLPRRLRGSRGGDPAHSDLAELAHGKRESGEEPPLGIGRNAVADFRHCIFNSFKS